jgi:hypothetical protein
MTAATLTIADFLLARIADDETVARGVEEYAAKRYGDDATEMLARRDIEGDDAWCTIGVARVLAECASKRAIVERATESVAHAGQDIERQWALRALASIYADHRDFHSDWAL